MADLTLGPQTQTDPIARLIAQVQQGFDATQRSLSKQQERISEMEDAIAAMRDTQASLLQQLEQQRELVERLTGAM